MLSQLPQFQAARRHSVTLTVAGLGFAAAGIAVWRIAASELLWHTHVAVPRALGYMGPAFAIAAAGFLSAALMAWARAGLTAAERKGEAAPKPVFVRPTADTAIRRLQARAVFYIAASRRWLPQAPMLAGWPQSLAAAALGAAALAGVAMLWRMPMSADTPATQHIFGAALIGLAFPLLVLERLYANVSPQMLPEAPQISRLLRVPLTVAVGLAVTLLLASAGFSWSRYVQDLMALLLFAIGIELLIRGAAMLFIPYAPLETRRAVADSAIARFVLRLTIPNFRTINLTVRNQFGIDLSRSWALAFVRQAALPVLAGLGVFSWCVTGVTELGVDQRGIYERLGTPVAVLGPGLHIHMPWPFGSVRLEENGTIHRLPIEFLLPSGNGAQASTTAQEETEKLPGAEDTPPPDEDRLWDDDHPFEGVYLNAHVVDGKQSFQLADTDMTVFYRVGLSDEAVRDVAYRVANPDDLIQAISGQLITAYFAQHSLLDIIGSSRESFTTQFTRQLQAALDKASSGIEIMTVSIEAVHPPAGAADAYHNVQAAGIRADTAVFTSKGDATRQLSTAQMQADSAHAQAVAAAAELVAQAKTDGTLFDAERKAYATAGNAFLLERWLDDLNQALAKTTSLVLVDHRLQGADVPTLDLRLSGTGTIAATGAGATAPADPNNPAPPVIPPAFQEGDD
jgi:regulator of protease activity HflC (stomatin/prohibitin superfamily)